MKAMVLLEPQKAEIRDMPRPDCPAGGVLVNIKACGICAADIKMAAKGHRALTYPRIPGHEMAGIIVESRNNCFEKGERVQVAPGLRCGRCVQCLNHTDNQCEHREILGFSRDGGFAEYLAVPLEGEIIGAAHRLPDSVSFAEATLAEPIACCMNAQQKLAVKKTDSVLIMGGGTLGLMHAFVARQKGAETILIAEPLAYRRNIAAEHWTTAAFDPASADFFDSVLTATGGRGIDVLIFATSAIGPDERFLDLMASGGRISIFSGRTPPISQMPFDLNLIHYKELMISGAYGCTATQNAMALELLAVAKPALHTLLSRRLTLDTIQAGLNPAASDKTIKTIVEM